MPDHPETRRTDRGSIWIDAAPDKDLSRICAAFYDPALPIDRQVEITVEGPDDECGHVFLSLAEARAWAARILAEFPT